MAHEMTKDDLDRYIGDAVEKAVEKSNAAMIDVIRGLREDLLSTESVEKANAAEDKANREWEKASSAERNKAVKAAIAGEQPKKRASWKNRGADQKGSDFAAFAMLALRTGGDLEKAKHIAAERGADRMVEALNRTLAAGDFDSGGAFIPEEFASDFIEYLYDASVVRAAGARTVDISASGNLTIPKLTGSSTGYWIGEAAPITESEPTTGQVKLEAKKLGVLVPMSGDLIKYASGFANQIAVDDLLMSMALAEDLAFLRGDGTANQPTGVLNLMAAGNKFDTAGTSHAQKVTDLIRLEYKLDSKNVRNIQRAMFMHSRARAGLMLTLTSDGAYAFLPELSMNGTVMGKPVYVSNQIPTNLDTSTLGNNNETDVYLCEMSELLIGETGEVEVTRSNAHSSNFASDIETIRGLHRVGFQMRHDAAAAVVQQTVWGASL